MARARTSPSACAQVVAQPEPAMPQPSRKMNSWLSSAFASAVTQVTSSVARGRPMPLKKPNMAHTAAPRKAPPTRGNQKSPASRVISGSKPSGASSTCRAAPTATNSGAAHSVPQSAVHTARPAHW